MKRKNIAIGLGFGCTVLFIVMFWLAFLRAWSEEARDVQVHDICRRLSIKIEGFRIEKGRYPHSLTELQSVDDQTETEKELIRGLFGVIQHNDWHDRYDYLPSTNGFTIIVTGPKPVPTGWFGKERRIEKNYKTEDVSKEFKSSQ